jgi:hypothetical protein
VTIGRGERVDHDCIDVLVLSGDLANQGEADAYVRLRPLIDAALERFGAKLLVAPGNHDDVSLLRLNCSDGRRSAQEPWPAFPCGVSPATGSHADVLARDRFRGHAGGGFSRIDVLGDGEIVVTLSADRARRDSVRDRTARGLRCRRRLPGRFARGEQVG